VRDDLVDAYAAVDWARGHIPVVEAQLDEWMNAPPFLLIEELRPEEGRKYFKLEANRPFPNIANAGVGAIINSARSSLDLLASSLARRNGVARRRDIYFPFAKSFGHYSNPTQIAKRKKWLSAGDMAIIDSFQPYGGGNGLLYALHTLDNTRKHERLLDVHLVPSSFVVTPEAHRQGLQFPLVWKGFEAGTVMAWAPINAMNTDFVMTSEIMFRETGAVNRLRVIDTLRQFAGMVDSIIQRFE
jgi:hypothetical protein